MKFILLITMLFSFEAYSKVCYSPIPKNGRIYKTKSKCESSQADPCFDICGKDLRRWMIGQEDDLTKPNYRPVESSPVKMDCNDFSDCALKATNPDGDPETVDQVCLADASTPRWGDLSNFNGITGVSGPWFIWCQKEDGTFSKKSVLVPDASGSTAADAEDAQKVQIKAMAEAGKKAIDVGLKVKKIMVGMIKLKKLPKSARKQLRGDLKSIIEALDVGSIDIAIDEIKALVEDGVVVTPEAKATILQLFAAEGYDIS